MNGFLDFPCRIDTLIYKAESLDIESNGCGMTKQATEKVSIPLRKTGLGLSIFQGIIEQDDGQLIVEPGLCIRKPKRRFCCPKPLHAKLIQGQIKIGLRTMI
ncbi:hypothetical protein AB835_06185 [Candidatus Endobugula sertula]|uniref:Histidine kinase/HSP90-like ATPase domain-containing protein n=1 Tax=Candidatus Endobugula sertula TaxID=62101 RepID=A0A1D2QQZ0_9GAMM|nr:hypothetical protein AB835_06185 [Candidatus Endobugula sertula]